MHFCRIEYLIKKNLVNIGIIRELEQKLGHAVHWSICLLHFNELPLRELFGELDGVTQGPKQFSGPIGKMLESCEKKPIVKFNRVYSDNLPILTENVVRDLSCDQKYLYEICNAIKLGMISPSLKMRAPGTLVHSRFLTTANRILRFYVSNNKPSKNLVTLVDFIIKVYAPMWFAIKSKENFKMGPKLLFNYIKLIRQYFDKKTQNTIFKVVDRNSYFVHPENILVAMLTDENRAIRDRAVKSILVARNSKSQVLRKFIKHNVNFSATNYCDMANIELIDPPITTNRTDDSVRECIESAENWVNKAIEGIPSHTQAVERYIKLVSSVSSQAIGEQNRNQRIYTTIASRLALPKPNSKKDFVQYIQN